SIFFTGSTFFNGNSQIAIGNYYRPLLTTYFAGIYSLSGANYFLFHFFQLLLHIVNTIMVFFFLKHFLKGAITLFLSLLFLVHPINSEVVFYISDAQEVLFFFFGML